MSAEISYGKWQIGVYRTYAKPLAGIAPILESPFLGRENTLFAAEIGGPFTDSGVLFGRARNSRALAVIELERVGDSARITEHRCGVVGLQLIKVTGSSFASFARDQYTTLPERPDRPLFIYLDVF